MLYFKTLKELVEYLETKYNEKINELPMFPYEKNISFYGNTFKAIVYRLPLTGCYELINYSIKG